LLFVPFFITSKSVDFLPVLLITVVVAVIYSAKPFRTKQIPLLDSVTSSLHFVLPVVVGIFWVGGVGLPWLLLISYFMWGVASHILGALPDIEADKKAGESTVATFLGYHRASILTVFFYIASVVVLLFSSVPVILQILLIPYVMNAAVAIKKIYSPRNHFRFFMFYNLFYGFCVSIVILSSYFL